MNKVVVIEVTGGVADILYSSPDIDIHMVDWDNPENGGCALCGGEIDLDDDDASREGMHKECLELYEELSKLWEPEK